LLCFNDNFPFSRLLGAPIVIGVDDELEGKITPILPERTPGDSSSLMMNSDEEDNLLQSQRNTAVVEQETIQQSFRKKGGRRKKRESTGEKKITSKSNNNDNNSGVGSSSPTITTATTTSSSSTSPIFDANDIKSAIKKLIKSHLFKLVKTTGFRPDGRTPEEIRPISMELSWLPGTHGSSLFTRGETQSISTATLGGKEMEQRIDRIDYSGTKRYYLQYRFPPSCVGEVTYYI
jgi:polyribonucleotide nucleotidyltransferase